MKRKILFFCTLLITQIINAQPLPCNSSNCNTNTTINNCPSGSTTIVTTFINPVQKAGNPCGNGLCNNAVWRFAGVATQGTTTINAEIKIISSVNAILDNIDDNVNTGVATNLFAPRIRPDVDLGTVTNRRGWVEFEIKFYDAGAGDGFTNLKALENLNFVHYDIDGGGNNTSWFREMGHIKQTTNATNPSIQAYTATELSADSYTEATFLWKGFLGSVCERDAVSSCAEVAVQANFSAPQNTVNFRMGYDSKAGGNGAGQPVRQYGARFGCFQFPTTGNLPVTLNNFTLNKTGSDNVALYWQTSTEINNAGFEIQRSVNGSTNFITIAEMASKAINGNSSAALQYNFNDRTNYKGTVYYRIMQKDINGRLTYSEIKSIQLGDLQPITVYPNPSKNGKIEVKVPNTMFGAVVSLRAANGTTVSVQKITTNLFTIEGLSTGFYYLNITNEANQIIATQKIIVQ